MLLLLLKENQINRTEKALRLAAAGGKKDFMQVIIIDPEIEILEIDSSYVNIQAY